MAGEKSEGKQVTRSESGRPERMPRITNPFEDMDRMFENFFPQSWMRPFRMGRMWNDVSEGVSPRVDVIDRDNELLIRAEVPGVDKKDLDISLSDHSVTIRGSTRRSEEEEKGEYYRCEIAQGAFSRTIPLPADVDSNSANASFKDGILELKLPKVEKSKRRSIPVS